MRYLNKNAEMRKDWLTAEMSCVMLPALLRVSKYMWFMFYLPSKMFLLFIFPSFIKGSVLINNGWRASSGTPTTV